MEIDCPQVAIGQSVEIPKGDMWHSKEVTPHLEVSKHRKHPNVTTQLESTLSIIEPCPFILQRKPLRID